MDVCCSSRIRSAIPSVVGAMADVILLERHRAQRSPGSRSPGATFSFDLGSPATYLAAERVDRLFEGIRWRPVLGPGPGGRGVDAAHVERRARELRLPLRWPERDAATVAASRVAYLAVERGRGAAFVLAASRLAFCGGFDLDDPEVLLEAAAAAGLTAGEARVAAGDPSRDLEL
ncbi:MAG: DsbA family protein, partial [Actinomycetota bacterium]|nr:DsbA family protein [Actinomycetota bacterium]